MTWVIGGIILLMFGILLRWILNLGSSQSARTTRMAQLGAEREAIYQPIVLEIETQSAILGISLNDAMNERDAGQPEIAWRLVRLSLSEWDRLAEILNALNAVMSNYVGSSRAVIPDRPVVADRFKSQVMIDYARMHELFDQLVFRSRLRFQLHLRMLRRANEILTTEIHRAYRYADQIDDRPPNLWQRLDFYFHDFDLIAKETLLLFRTLLASMPHARLAGLSEDLKSVVRHGVRSNVST